MVTESPVTGDASVAESARSVVFELDNYDLTGFLAVASGFGTEKYGFVATPNVDGLIRQYENDWFRSHCAQAAYVLLDSRVAALLFRLVHGLRISVCPGSDLTAALFRQVILPSDRVVLIGSTEPQAQFLRERFGLRDLCHHNPPMGFINDEAAVEACLQFVEAASPFRFCLLAIGDPMGVIIAQKLFDRGRSRGLALVVGASVDFITGKQRRAPTWMQRIGFEWLYRLLQNPRRLARRYLIRGPKFFLYVLASKVLLRPSGTGAT